MKQSNFSLADVLTVLTALAFGFVCFLGENFITMGDTRQSIILASIIILLLVATALGAKLIKRAKGNFKTNLICEVILLILFSGFMVYFTIRPFSHYFVVTEKKQVIQNTLAASITQAGNMFPEYKIYAKNREDLYKSTLDRVVANKDVDPPTFIKVGFVTSVRPEAQIQYKIQTLRDDLFPSNYMDTTKTGVKDVAMAWLHDANIKVDNWKPIGIVSVANEVEHNSNEWRDSLVSISSIRENGEHDAVDFKYDLLSYSVKEHFTKLEKPTALAIGFSVAAYVLILLSWFVSKRDSRSIGALQTASYEVVL